MKVRASVKKWVEIEVEVSDKYLPLSNDAIWTDNYRLAMELSNELAFTVENSEDDIEVYCIETMDGKIIFE